MRNGVTSQTVSNILIGPGAIYKDFINPASPGTLIGATSGGNTFRINREFYNPEIDGLLGPLKGAGRLVKEIPEIEANLVEITKENLMLALAGTSQASYGSPATHTKITSDGAISDGNYINSIAIVGEKAGTNQPICLVIKNALAQEPVELPLGDGKGTVVLKTKFTGHYTQASPSLPPWEIYSPN